MGVFDQALRRRRPQNDGARNSTEQLEDLSKEVPEIDSTLDKIDKALRLAKQSQKGAPLRGCICF